MPTLHLDYVDGTERQACFADTNHELYLDITTWLNLGSPRHITCEVTADTDTQET